MQSRLFTQQHFETNRESHRLQMLWFQPLVITEWRQCTNNVDVVTHDDVVLQE